MSGFNNRSVDASHFAMVPRSDVPRSVFHVESSHKTTFDAGYLVPVYVDEVLPGDTFDMKMTAFARMATPIFPVMDNLTLSSFFFFVPCRLVWDNWQKFMGERTPDPSSSIDYLVPSLNWGGTHAVNSLADYMGLPTSGSVPGGSVTFNTLPFRAYNLIWNEWFRDENLQNSIPVPLTDSGDNMANYVLRRRGKRHDYFTSALPWPQKGNPATIPLQGTAPIKGIGLSGLGFFGSSPKNFYETGGTAATAWSGWSGSSVALAAPQNPGGADQFIGIQQNDTTGYPEVYADLSQATAVTINALRQAFQIQKLLERDARGGTRYTEILRSHFGVISPDARLQRPEYLGGGTAPININPVAQTSVTSTTPLGNLAGVGTGVAHHGFNKSFVEHGYIIGLVNIRADLTYQQGMRKMWFRSTRYDFYWPAFAHLGEQTITNNEIYANGGTTGDAAFGYQERYAEYRYFPSMITGKFKSGVTGTLDAWHLAQQFSSSPVLNDTFIQDTPPVSRVVAAGTAANGQQFLFDSLFSCRKIRPLPMFGVPGFIDRF